VAGAKTFYGAVFGWTFHSSPDDESYTLIQLDGRDIGGIFLPSNDKAARRARWLSFFSVADADAAVRQVEKSGGRVVAKPGTLRWRGKHALLSDAAGAVFGVIQSNTADVAESAVADNDFFWVDLFTLAPVTAANFYRDLAGYEVSEENFGPGVDRVVLSSGGYARAGIVPLPQAVKKPGWLPYVLVSDISGTLDKATKAGGRIVLAPRADLLNGQLAVMADPSGGVIGIVNWTTPTAP
jgi:predicted enzyme related to lactoylglutathione lyase